MIKITISPLFDGSHQEVVGTIKKVKLLGMTIIIKVIEMPNKYGVKEWGNYCAR
jgi:hypothetical protein